LHLIAGTIFSPLSQKNKQNISRDLNTDMKIVLSGSGGAVLNLDWFLNYHDIKLVRKASEKGRKDDFLANIQAISAFRGHSRK
jgi:hypothetical protein